MNYEVMFMDIFSGISQKNAKIFLNFQELRKEKSKKKFVLLFNYLYKQ